MHIPVFFSSRCGNHGILVDPLRRSWAWQPSVSADVRKAVDVGNFRMNQLEMSGNFRSSGISNTFFFSEKYYREPVLPNWLTLSGLDEKLGFWDSCNVFFIVVFHIECFVKLSEQDSELQNQRYMLGISSLSASHVFDRETKTRCRKNKAEFPVSLSQQIPVCRIVQNFLTATP